MASTSYFEWRHEGTKKIPYSLKEFIHNSKHRMPAILSKEDEEKWLDPYLSKEEIESLLTPFEADRMDAYVIKNDFIKKAPSDPTILERA